jgi:integrase
VRLLEAKKTDRSQATLAIYRQKLGHFVRLWGVSMRLVDINTAVCDQYVATRRAERVTDHTIVKEFNCLNQLLKLATRAGCYSGQIAMLRPLDVAPRYEPRKRALPPSEVDALLRECKPRLWAFVALTVALGTRLSETLKFRPGDVDTKTWIANIKRTKTRKGTKVIPVLPPFRGFILRAVPELPITKYNNIRRDLASACRRAGIAKATPNDLRRSQGTMLVEAGVTLDACSVTRLPAWSRWSTASRDPRRWRSWRRRTFMAWHSSRAERRGCRTAWCSTHTKGHEFATRGRRLS